MIEGPRIFRYVVRQDRGGSPNPFHGWCSLAVCKPQIRRSARVGDWIVGLRSRHNDQLIYAMRVDEVMALGNYWADPRFVAKRPRGDGRPDNFYRATANGSMKQVANTLHDDSEAARDIAGLNALVSWHFWYFGDQSPPLSTELVQKSAMAGCPCLIAVSAPTAQALRLAETAGITLVAFARAGGFDVYSHPERISAEDAHVA